MAKRNRPSRQKTKTTVDAQAGDPPVVIDTDAAPSPGDSPASKRRLVMIAACFVAVWWVILGGLVVFTANPITLNRRQIHLSQRNGSIVTARIVDADTGKIEVLKDWTAGQTKGNELTVSDLKKHGVANGESYILPLTVSQKGTLRITPAAESIKLPPIYPANEETERQLEELLKEWDSE